MIKKYLIILKNKSHFSAIFDASDPYENYPNKTKACIKRAFWLQPEARMSMNNNQRRIQNHV